MTQAQTDPEHLAFRALADPTRRDILRLLAVQDMSIAEVTDNFDMTRAAIKKHLVILDEGGLITSHTTGRTRLNTLNPQGLKRVTDWLGFFDALWDDRLGTLKLIIQKDTQ